MDFYEKVLKDAEETARYFVECEHLSQEEAEQMFPGLREHVPYSDNELNEAAETKKEQKSINLHNKIEELCSKYPINKYSMSNKELSAYHQGVHLGATKIAEYLSEQRSIELSEEEIIKTIKTEISQIGTTAYENYTHDSSDKEYWTYMTCKKITNLINSLRNGN